MKNGWTKIVLAILASWSIPILGFAVSYGKWTERVDTVVERLDNLEKKLDMLRVDTVVERLDNLEKKLDTLLIRDQ